MQLVLNKNNGNYTMDDCSFHRYENVTSYNYEVCQSIINVNLSDEVISTKEEDKQVYYIFDCPGKDAFIHWITESFIFYPLFLKIKQLYPSIKILTTNTKKYVKNIFNFFNIESEIVYEIEEEVKPNICFFPPVVSLNDLDDNNKDLFEKFLYDYMEHATSILREYNFRENKILFLPRNSVDNFTANDRIIHGSDDIEKNIIEIGGTVLNTYQINNIHLQLSIVSSSNTIILDYGSSFFFNCLFLKNKKIVVLDNHNIRNGQINRFLSLQIMNECICKNNEVVFIDPKRDNTITYADIVDSL
jgi:hypothetical protein